MPRVIHQDGSHLLTRETWSHRILFRTLAIPAYKTLLVLLLPHASVSFPFCLPLRLFWLLVNPSGLKGFEGFSNLFRSQNTNQSLPIPSNPLGERINRTKPREKKKRRSGGKRPPWKRIRTRSGVWAHNCECNWSSFRSVERRKMFSPNVLLCYLWTRPNVSFFADNSAFPSLTGIQLPIVSTKKRSYP